jgi:hypothetical protein
MCWMGAMTFRRGVIWQNIMHTITHCDHTKVGYGPLYVKARY